MLRTRNVQPSLWESVLPEICLRLPAELERVDAWLARTWCGHGILAHNLIKITTIAAG